MAPLPYQPLAGCYVEFTFAQVEHVLACSQDIRDARRSAFANRLKNYQKAGFPSGINTGRGRAATYGVGHLLQLGLALELNQLGLNPERAKTVIESDVHSVAMAFSMAANVGPPEGEFEFPLFLYFDPAGLSDLMSEEREDRAVQSFHYAGWGQFVEQLKAWTTGGLQRLSFVNVSALLWDVGSYAAFQFSDVSPADFYEQVKIWASPHIHNEPYYGSNQEA